MVKTPDTPGAREALIDAVVDHLAARGRLDESLRATASAIGVGHSLLLYHFGSRDGMLTAVHAACEARQQRHFATLAPTSAEPEAIMREMWRHLADERMWPVYRLGFALRAARGPDPADDADRAAWVEAIEPLARALGHGPETAKDVALLWLATTRGLLWELVTGAGTEAIDRAAGQLMAGN
jgi:AcrR family transcriptional regulator